MTHQFLPLLVTFSNTCPLSRMRRRQSAADTCQDRPARRIQYTVRKAMYYYQPCATGNMRQIPIVRCPTARLIGSFSCQAKETTGLIAQGAPDL
jgi:hypothetical protein